MPVGASTRVVQQEGGRFTAEMCVCFACAFLQLMPKSLKDDHLHGQTEASFRVVKVTLDGIAFRRLKNIRGK